jgi:protein subunit release factor B
LATKSHKRRKKRNLLQLWVNWGFKVYFGAALWLNQTMAIFPDIVEASLRRRFVALGVRPEEVEERFIRGSGAGGQKVNKTSSTVCLRHTPTGIEVRCQRERSQMINRQLAWTELADKLTWRRTEAANQAQGERELIRRQKRQKSRGQKARMIEGKKYRARTKAARRGVGED